MTPMPGLPDHPPTPAEKLAIYDRYAEDYRQRTWDYTRFLGPDYDRFVAALPGPRVLDLGAGPGRDSVVFRDRGLSPVALDLSTSMLALCRAQGLETIQMDIEQLDLSPGSFAGVWSYTSLTTIPKDKVWPALAQVQSALAEEGVLFLGLIEGEGEGWKPPSEKYAVPRYVSRYQRDEVVAELSDWQLLYERRVPATQTGRNTYLHFLLRRAA